GHRPEKLKRSEGEVIAWLEAASGKAGKINGTDAKGVPNKYLAARKFMDACAAGNDDLWAAFAACWGDWQKAATKDYHLNPRFNGQTERLAQLPMAVPAIKDFIANFQAAMAQADQELTDLKDALLDALAAAVRAEYERRKDEAGVMTFDDMVLRAQKVLVGPDGKPRPEAAPLIVAARQRWRYALIDEFQDTDDRQWDIFRTLFSSDARKDGGAMLVVGDPKQAIYSFRGADVAAYLKAREHIVAANPKALHTLDTTFRCTERMTAVFNCLFSLPQWFPAAPAPAASAQPVPSAQPAPGAGGIAYAPVKWGGKYVADRDLAPLVLLESLSPRDMAAVAAGGTAGKGLGNADRCLPAFARAAAAEIKQLLGKVPGQVKGDDGLTDCAPLAYDDFCFLVRKGSEAAPIKRALAQAGIPYSHYKEAGLYRSADGESARAVFDFLAAPERPGNLQALLLTPFFGVPPQDLAARAAALDQGFWNLVGVWQALAAARDWAGLFASLLHASRVARRQGFDPEHGRRVAALRQIFDDLLFKCPERPRRDVADLSAMLRDWAAEERGDREAGVREKESEAPHVQIMTMHTAKGLEFPVVFLAAGLGPIARKGEPLTPEMVAEEKRLFYVALTRAKFRLYLPGTAAGDGLGLGSAGSAWRLGVVKETAKDEAPPAID
ncbi:MAG: UvrD-helicase domain-containing protein, partial [Planctomycetes bacterium]|nr:UvrD-helicase domain-containing protein [Planctomycetota bacterium]